VKSLMNVYLRMCLKTIGQVKWNGVTKTLLCFYSIHWPLGLSDSVSYILDKSACKHKN